MPLYQCVECGAHTLAPVEPTADGTASLDCPSCDHPELTSVHDRCRHGRTLLDGRDTPACWNEYVEGNRVPDEPHDRIPEGQARLCDKHYEKHMRVTLPDDAIGRCDEDDCTHAVYERVGDALLCEDCR